jgi:toxin ParE1/3/4
MQSYKIEITELAEIDLERVGDYMAYELRNPQAAIDTIRGIKEKMHSLEMFPERNEFDEDTKLAELGIRQEYYRNYKIYYIVDHIKQSVIIIRILHMLVDSRTWLYRAFDL